MPEPKKTISFRVPLRLYEDIIDICIKNGKKQSEFLREAVEDKLKAMNPKGNEVVIQVRIPRARWDEINYLYGVGEINDIDSYILHLLWNDCEKRAEKARAKEAMKLQ